MTDGQEQQSAIEAAIARMVANGRVSRRDFLRRAGQGGAYLGGALSISAILAACGISPTASNTPGATATPLVSVEPTPIPTPAGQLNFANWPLYIDTDENDSTKHKTIEDFQTATGIQVKYTEAIQDNQSFFGTIQPDLSAGNDTGWDLMVMTDWMLGRLVRLNFVEQIDVAGLVPNFGAHAGDKYKNPTYDPNNAHSVPWQSGITGIAYNPTLTKREITSYADLFDPAFKGKVGMFTDMYDSMNLALLGIGVKPLDATMTDVQNAQKKLLEQANAGIVRQYYDNSYTDALAKGDLWVTMAWSGDVFQLQFDNPDLKFVVPTEGGILWVDNMCIPAKAQHPIDAQAMMNFVYQPAIAAQITEWVNYICPVPEAQAVIKQDAQDAADGGDQETADYLNAVADSPLVFPTADMLNNLYSYKVLSESEEADWNDLFQQVTQG